MRNDARPIGGDTSHQSPVAGHGPPNVRQPSDVVNRGSGIYRPRPETPVDDRKPVPVRDADDPVMPANDETLNTNI
jgi:hypothetical protein